MPLPRLICPATPALIKRLHAQMLVVRVNNPATITDAARLVRGTDNELVCVLCETNQPLGRLEPIPEEWRGIPLALLLPAFRGNCDWAPWTRFLRELDAHVYLPGNQPENLVSLRILASLGVSCGAILSSDAPPDWEALTDLMSYALLGIVPHAPLDPFEYLANRYQPTRWNDWSGAMFADPQKYLHVDADGHVSLTATDLVEGRFVTDDVTALKDIETHPAYRAWVHRRSRFFTENHPCARCPGWRVCGGNFATSAERAPGCTAFFVEMMEIFDQRQKQRQQSQEPKKWQP